jgi:hypothetical protein
VTFAYYVTVRDETGRTMFALGPFTRYRRAKGLSTYVRRSVVDAGLDPYHAHGYGVSRTPMRDGIPTGALGAVLGVRPDVRAPISLRAPQTIPSAVLARLEVQR